MIPRPLITTKTINPNQPIIDLMLVEAKSWLGTPHRNFQRKKGLGVDCIMYALSVYQSAGLMVGATLPAYSPNAGLYTADTGTEEWVVQSGRFQQSSVESPKDGDLVIFKSGGVSAHVGIYIDGMVWHCYVKSGVIQSPYNTVKKSVLQVYSPFFPKIVNK